MAQSPAKDQTFGKNRPPADLQRLVLKQTSSTDGLLDESRQKKKLVYDKSLKAYFDPKTQEYFEIK